MSTRVIDRIKIQGHPLPSKISHNFTKTKKQDFLESSDSLNLKNETTKIDRIQLERNCFCKSAAPSLQREKSGVKYDTRKDDFEINALELLKSSCIRPKTQPAPIRYQKKHFLLKGKTVLSEGVLPKLNLNQGVVDENKKRRETLAECQRNISSRRSFRNNVNRTKLQRSNSLRLTKDTQNEIIDTDRHPINKNNDLQNIQTEEKKSSKVEHPPYCLDDEKPNNTASGFELVKDESTKNDIKNFSLIGTQLQTPRLNLDFDNQSENENFDLPSERWYNFYDFNEIPLPSRRRFLYDFNDSESQTSTSLDSCFLQQCLSINKTKDNLTDDRNKNKIPISEKQDTERKFKPTPFVSSKHNHKPWLQNKRYYFRTVDSYIYFNNLSPDLDTAFIQTNSTDFKRRFNQNGAKHFGLYRSADSVLLKLMLDTNNPKQNSFTLRNRELTKSFSDFKVVGKSTKKEMDKYLKQESIITHNDITGGHNDTNERSNSANINPQSKPNSSSSSQINENPSNINSEFEIKLPEELDFKK